MIPIDELATVPAFDGFDERALRAVGAMMRIISADSGEEILGQGARTGGAFIVLEGTVRVVRQVSDQRSVDLGVHERGSLFGLLACIDGEPRGTRVIARGPARVAEIPRAAVSELLEGRTPVALRFQVAVCRALFADVRSTNVRLAELAAIPDTELATYELEPLSAEL